MSTLICLSFADKRAQHSLDSKHQTAPPISNNSQSSRTMGEEATTEDATAGTKGKKVEKLPPDGYVCRLCSVPGHWIQVCPTKKTGSKKRKATDHVPVPGKDPSAEDIERAKELQAIPPPKCESSMHMYVLMYNAQCLQS